MRLIIRVLTCIFLSLVFMDLTTLAAKAASQTPVPAKPANGSCWSDSEVKDLVHHDNEISGIIYGMGKAMHALPRDAEGRDECPGLTKALDQFHACSGSATIIEYYRERASEENCYLSPRLEIHFSDLTGKAAFDEGDKYYYGRGVPLNYSTAMSWYFKGDS